MGDEELLFRLAIPAFIFAVCSLLPVIVLIQARQAVRPLQATHDTLRATLAEIRRATRLLGGSDPGMPRRP